MKRAIREISIALWAASTALAGGCQQVSPPPAAVIAPAATPTPNAPVPVLAGQIEGLDEALVDGLFE